MRLVATILRSVFFCSAVVLLFSSEKMKSTVVHVPIEWIGTADFAVENAKYPSEFHGFPMLSVSIEMSDIAETKIVNLIKSEIDSVAQQKLQQNFPTKADIITLRKMQDRGQEVMLMDILPFLYDSLSGKFYKVDALDIALIPNKKSATTSNQRKSDATGNSVLSSGDWYKIPVLSSGVYQIDYNYLKNAGINPATINPKNIKIYGNGGGMLPQQISETRPDDLVENAIFVAGESDNKFDQQDYILFYGQDADFHKITESGELDYQKNLYSDTTFYFLTIAQDAGLRLTNKENLGTNHPKIHEFDDYITYEKDDYNLINSGREWYGEKFDFTTTYDFKFDFSDLVPDSELKIISSVMGQTYADASIDLSVNGQALGQQAINRIVEGTYLAKGSIQTNEFTINTTTIPASEKFTVRMSFNPASGTSKASLNYLNVIGKRKLKLFDNQTRFRSVQSTQQAISTYEIENSNTNIQIWDVTNPLHPYQQQFSLSGNTASFGALSSELREFIVFKNNDFLIPEKALKIHEQNLHGLTSMDLLIISPLDFLPEATRLADLRQNHDGLSVAVVTPQQIYNEFSSGKQDVSAIRDFIKYIYDQGDDDSRLQNVLLFGKSTFDYKDRVANNTNFVPIYSSRNSLHPINSYSSDDYYGFLDDGEGEWSESYSGDHLMDVGIGRLPVKNLAEAKIVVDKLIKYATDPSTFGPWRNELFFVADDGDGNLHQRDADRLAQLVDTAYTQFNVNKIYVDAFEQVESSIGEICPGANAEIARTIDKGGLIFNYTGHGSATRWASETILNISSVSEFKNINRLPLFVTATCEFGRHDNPMSISGAEYTLLNPNGGAIGLLTTARPVFSSTNFILNEAFYNNVFEKENGKYATIGEIFRKTKNQSLKGSVNRNFSLLADPSMTLAYGKDEVILSMATDANQPGDTLSALGVVKLKGSVLDINGNTNTSFNGDVIATVFDISRDVETLGHEDSPMSYSVRDNLIFKGNVSVKNGAFTIEFIVPKNITFDYKHGKISLYAIDASQNLDAAGSNIEFVIGGESDDIITDNTPPEISLFMNDSTFVEGGITGSDALFLGQLSDERGINISSGDPAQELVAVLDDSITTILNAYYVSKKDSYKEGWVTYPYKGLSTGNHQIQLYAWDVHGNFNEGKLEFIVAENAQLAIRKLMNFPNPFQDITKFSFEHNRAGEDLDINIDIYSVDGKLVKSYAQTVENSATRITSFEWDGKTGNGENLAGGVYIFRLSVRSLADGSKKQANQKLVIIN